MSAPSVNHSTIGSSNALASSRRSWSHHRSASTVTACSSGPRAPLALVLGAFGGWIARGSDEGGDPALLLAGPGELTARQEQMFDLIAENLDAWHAGDGDAAVAAYTPTGTATFLGTTFRVDDGSLADHVGVGSWGSLEMYSPMLVNGNEIVSFHTFGGTTYTDVVEFTPTGDVLIVEHTISNWGR